MTTSTKRRSSDLSRADVETRLRGAITFEAARSDFDLPEPDYENRGRPYWSAETFERWFETYLSDSEIRAAAYAQWLAGEEASLRAQHGRQDAAEKQAAEDVPGSLQAMIKAVNVTGKRDD